MWSPFSSEILTFTLWFPKDFSLWPERFQAILCVENCLNFLLKCVCVFPKAFLQWLHLAEAVW